ARNMRPPARGQSPTVAGEGSSKGRSCALRLFRVRDRTTFKCSAANYLTLSIGVHQSILDTVWTRSVGKARNGRIFLASPTGGDGFPVKSVEVALFQRFTKGDLWCRLVV